MNTRDDGGPAFSEPWTNDGDLNCTAPDGQLVPPGYTVQMRGMSLRDYFAATALQGMLAGWPVDAKAPEEKIAARCYSFADAMLAARQS